MSLKTRVKDVYQRYTPQLELVAKDAPIDEIIDRVADDRGSRSVFVVGEDKTLVGIIRMQDIMHRVGAKHVSTRGLIGAADRLATVAKHMMIEPLSVTPEDEIDEALRIAVQFNLEDVPVVSDGKVVGQIDCFEILYGVRKT